MDVSHHKRLSGWAFVSCIRWKRSVGELSSHGLTKTFFHNADHAGISFQIIERRHAETFGPQAKGWTMRTSRVHARLVWLLFLFSCGYHKQSITTEIFRGKTPSNSKPWLLLRKRNKRRVNESLESRHLHRPSLLCPTRKNGCPISRNMDIRSWRRLTRPKLID